MMNSVQHRMLAAAVLFLLAGCGGTDYGPTGKISGKLTMMGKPLESGTGVSFMQMETGFLAFGITDAEGKFTVKSFNEGNMPVGKYKVMIAPPTAEAPAEEISVEEAFEKPELLDPTSKVEFPSKFRDVTTSGLEYDIKEGDNVVNIDLTL